MTPHVPTAPAMRAAGESTFTVENQDNALDLLSRIHSHASSPTRCWQAVATWFVLVKTMGTWNSNIVVSTPAEISALARFKDPMIALAALELLTSLDAVRLLRPKPHHSKTSYLLSPHLVWRGSVANRADAIVEWDSWHP